MLPHFLDLGIVFVDHSLDSVRYKVELVGNYMGILVKVPTYLLRNKLAQASALMLAESMEILC